MISHTAAKAQGLTRYFTGVTCRRGHVAERKVSDRDCVECVRLRSAQERVSQPNLVAARQKRYGAKKAPIINAKSAAWYAANKARAKATRAAWRERNAAKVRADVAAYQAANKERLRTAAKVWLRENRDWCAARAAKHRAQKIRATPAWANEVAITELYAAAQAMSALSGKTYHVDHIVPLRSKRVCGLHCEANLQILSGAENQRKSNRIWPDMPLAA